MTAKEMFTRLGYEIDINVLSIIRYAKHMNEEDYYIRFDTEYKEFDCNRIIDNEILPLHIDMELLQIINQQCKELGWFDE